MTILRYLWIIFCLGLSWIVPAAIEQIDRRRKERPRSESRSRHRRRPQPDLITRPVTQYHPQKSLLWASHFSPPQASTDFSSRCQCLRAPQGCNDSTSRNLQLLQLPGMAGVACGFISPMEFSAGHRLSQISSALTKLFYDFAAVYYCFAGNL